MVTRQPLKSRNLALWYLFFIVFLFSLQGVLSKPTMIFGSLSTLTLASLLCHPGQNSLDEPGCTRKWTKPWTKQRHAVFCLLETLVRAKQLLFVNCFVPEHQAPLFMIESSGIISACTRTRGHKVQPNLSEILQIWLLRELRITVIFFREIRLCKEYYNKAAHRIQNGVSKKE